MKHYLLSIYQPDVEPPPPEVLGPVMEKVNAMVREAKQAGVWVFNGGLGAPESACVVRVQKSARLKTDGPYIETREHIGGFLVVKAPDLDTALGWAGKLADALTLPGQTSGLPVEVREFAHTGG
jgi:hypothetical protein